jgi:hypothetical protein
VRSAYTGRVYAVEHRCGYGVVLLGLITTNGSAAYLSRYLCDRVVLGDLTIVEPEWRLGFEDMSTRLRLVACDACKDTKRR